jgi:integrase
MPKPRLQSISPADEQIIYANVEPQFRNFPFSALHTGLRPFCELAQVKAEHVEQTPPGMMWRVYSSKTKKTRKIPVRPEVAKLVQQLIKDAPAGSGRPLFRNTKGNPWQRTAGVVRFLNLRKKLGWYGDPCARKVHVL